MEINKTIDVFMQALETLKEGIDLFDKYEDIFDKTPSEENRQLFTSMRDSLIQRFEYTIDLFCKLMKIYLISIEKIDVLIQSPRGIIRAAVKDGILSERESDECMDMIESRNKTSHTYHEIMADEIAHAVPVYYNLIRTITDRIFSKKE